MGIVVVAAALASSSIVVTEAGSTVVGRASHIRTVGEREPYLYIA